MTQLHLARELSLPIDAVTQKFAFFGKNGSGKTYAAIKLAELMLAARGQIVALDPVGVWYGLRLAANGKTPSGIEIPVFGGLYGDIPLEPGAGALIADVIVDRHISAVIDVSQFEYDTDRAKFITAFAERLFYRKKAAPSAIHIFFEEAQEFLPITPQPGEQKMLHQCLRIGKIGRNYGFGVSIISPRPQEITTKARNLTECVLAFQTNGTHERKAIAEWVKEKGSDTDVVALLPKFKVGEAHAWSPSWLDFSGTIHVLEKKTFNASATPKVGAAAVEARPLAPIDIERLRVDMAATIERAKAEDPSELRRVIAERDREIRQLKTAPGKSVEKPVVDQAAIDRAVHQVVKEERKKAAAFLSRLVPDIQTSTRNALQLHERLVATLNEVVNESDSLKLAMPLPSSGRSPENEIQAPRPAEPRQAAVRAFVSSPAPEGLTPSKMRLLNALAAFESLGFDRVRVVNVAFFAGYTVNGHFNNMKGELRTAGLLDYPEPDHLALTDAGREIASAGAHPISSLSDLHSAWLNKLTPSEGKLLSELITAYPDSIEKSELAARCGYTVNGHFNNMVGHLKTLGAISYPTKGFAAATEALFPRGLR